LAARLAAYGELLLAANRRLNLTAARTPEAVAEHISDSLTLQAYVSERLVDVGSGGGLPGIPLAIATGAELLLIETTAKKAAFLAEALAELGLAGTVEAERAELVARDPRYREQYGSATARAVASAPAVAELTVPFLRIGGQALLQRGNLDEFERQALTDAAPMLGARFAAERPLEGARRILILEKMEATPQRFPRRAGVPEKRPLCLSRRCP
jgi:16S rRNA (guanine527-N7)-methyltransferase